jgi:hypothetical protein
MEFLDLELDRRANETCQPDADIAMAALAARVLLIGTREDLTIMRDARRLLSAPMSQPQGGERARLPQ